ncbi:MAG: hypothetical protein WKF79_02775 [Nocardioides sp.]
MTRRSVLVFSVPAILAILAALGLSSCGSDPVPELDYGSERVAPLASEVEESGSDTEPGAEDALVELDLDAGGVAALWIDPDDIRKVYVQYSDPADADAWTEPVLVYEAGDGCLTMHADTAATTVAVGLGCYETDAFIQQAPDEGVALVSTDFQTWDEDGVGESVPVPEVSEDGTKVVFRNDVYDGRVDTRWERGEGF